MRTLASDGALRSKLASAGVGTGDEVILPSYGGIEVLTAVQSVGAIPVFVDIEPRSLCLDPAAAAQAVTERTAAVVPVHVFGHPADMVCLRALTQRHGLLMVEHSTEPRPAAATVARRRANARFLEARLTGLRTPSELAGVEHSYEQYVVRVPGNGRPDRDAYARALRHRGVPCRVPVPTPAHRLGNCRTSLALPQTERAAAECLTLPAGAEASRRELSRVVSACRALGGLVLEPVC